MPTLEKITKSPDKCPGDGSNNDGDDTAMTDHDAVAAETVASSSKDFVVAVPSFGYAVMV